MSFFHSLYALYISCHNKQKRPVDCKCIAIGDVPNAPHPISPTVQTSWCSFMQTLRLIGDVIGGAGLFFRNSNGNHRLAADDI